MERLIKAMESIPKTENWVSIDHQFLTQERYEQIRQFREKFFENENEDARKCPFLGPEVAASWNRSRNYKFNHKKLENKKVLTPKEYNEILDKNSHVIDITRPLFSAFKDLATFHGNALYLFDVTCLRLLLQSEKTYINMPENYIWDESTMGTAAHSLCMLLKRPVQLLGLEYYSDAFADTDIVVSAAPIMNENGEVIACIAFRQDMTNPPWGKDFQNMRSHTLGLIYAMAIAIENGIKLKKSYDHLESANNTLKATWSLIDEGLILIDQTGRINHINKEGSRILKLNPNEKKNKNSNIKDFLIKQSSLLQMVEKGENIDVEDTIRTGNDEEQYFVNIRPIIKQSDKQANSAVLRLTPIEKINDIVTKRLGAYSSYGFEDIIGESPAFKSTVTTAKRFATLPENILLTGESGTGKELFAHAIHTDYRPKGPFIAVNCAAIPRNLIESELLGYEGGSFTGAERSGRPGKIELANGGTLFLDEIGDMPFELQAVLLRVLEDKKIIRIGGRRYKQVDFRLIAATNKDLYQLAKNGHFREDLFYRLSVLTIKIPALRERDNDVEVLSSYFIKNYCSKMGRSIPKLNSTALKMIKDYKWPGNVRQLENAMIYAVNVTNGEVIYPDNLPNYIEEEALVTENTDIKTAAINSLKNSEKNLEKNLIEEAFVRSKYDVAKAATMLKISKSSMYRKLRKFGIEY